MDNQIAFSPYLHERLVIQDQWFYIPDGHYLTYIFLACRIEVLPVLLVAIVH